MFLRFLPALNKRIYSMDFLYKVQTRFLFRTPIRIKIPLSCPDSLFDEFFTVFSTVDQKFNSYKKGSVTDRINQHAGQLIEIDEETERLFRRVIEVSLLTEGKFDITIMPLLRLWGFYKDSGRLYPSPEKIKNTLARVNFTKIKIERGRMGIGRKQEITTGGFLKAYAMDCLIEHIRQRGITDVIINAGGSSIACLNNRQHPFWSVVITDPGDKKIAGRLKLSNSCCSTAAAGSSQVVISGKKYGHVFDPHTGYPVSNLQCGIITGDCLSGDILSTGLLGYNPDDFLHRLKQLSGLISPEGYLITEKNELICSNGLVNYFTNVCV